MTAALTLPIAPDPDRKWWVGENAGETFEQDVDYDGLAVTIELRTEAEARAVADYLAALATGGAS